MIAYLKGKLIVKEPNRVVVETGGVGYAAVISVSTFTGIGEIGAPVELFIHTHLTDESISLFGFATARERETFLKLIHVSGIGPKLAVNILSGISPDDLEEAVRSSDISRLTLVPGIGKKTALRLAMELQDKLDKKEKVLAAKDSPEKADLTSALLNMGFRRKEVERAVDETLAALGRDAGIDKLLRECLLRLARI